MVTHRGGTHNQPKNNNNNKNDFNKSYAQMFLVQCDAYCTPSKYRILVNFSCISNQEL